MKIHLKQAPGIQSLCFGLPVFLLAAAILSAVLSLGVSLSPDSDYYISGARSLLSQGTLSFFSSQGDLVSITHFPPLTSLLLTLFHPISSESFFLTAKFIDVLFFSLFTFFAFFSVQLACRDIKFSLFSAVVCMFSTDLILVCVRVWSEPGYILFSTLSLLFLAFALIRQNQERRFLFATSICLSLAFLSRYVGLSLIMSAVLVVTLSHFFYKRAGTFSLIKSLLWLTLLPILTVSGWFLRNQMISGSVTNRPLQLVNPRNPINYERFIRYIDQAAVWFCPTAIPRPLRVLFIVGLSIAMIALLRFAIKQFKSDALTRHALLVSTPFLIYPWVHYLFINVTHVLIGDGYPGEYYPDEYRYFSPLHVSFLIGATSLLGGTWHHIKEKTLRTAILITMFWILFVNVARGTRFISMAYREGHSGGTTLEIISQPGFQHFLTLKKTDPVWVFGNFSDATYFLAYREIQLLPSKFPPKIESDFCSAPGFLFVPNKRLNEWRQEFALRPWAKKATLTLLIETKGLHDFTVFRTEPCGLSK